MQYNFLLSDSDEEPDAEQEERAEVQEAGGGPYEVDLLLDAVLDAQAVAESGEALAPAASPSPATTPDVCWRRFGRPRWGRRAVFCGPAPRFRERAWRWSMRRYV